jgi:hypothetical protein
MLAFWGHGRDVLEVGRPHGNVIAGLGDRKGIAPTSKIFGAYPALLWKKGGYFQHGSC